ncbi:hypothetical protein [Streptomyces zaehneri]|uniref:hypothetical protein n=1 Tax=Streptomyces zaehneri TaxID=3051180 RepID=UPI0028D3F6A1|nr:hypothetical protein [Streptomyces sp. DSM 40713]
MTSTPTNSPRPPLACYWAQEPDGTRWLVPGCVARCTTRTYQPDYSDLGTTLSAGWTEQYTLETGDGTTVPTGPAHLLQLLDSRHAMPFPADERADQLARIVDRALAEQPDDDLTCASITSDVIQRRAAAEGTSTSRTPRPSTSSTSASTSAGSVSRPPPPKTRRQAGTRRRQTPARAPPRRRPETTTSPPRGRPDHSIGPSTPAPGSVIVGPTITPTTAAQNTLPDRDRWSGLMVAALVGAPR